MMKKPSVISALGLAASIAVLATWLSPWSGVPAVQAATIIGKLNQQIEQDPLIDITLDSLHFDEAFINGRLQVSDQGIAGDIEVVVREGSAEPVVEVGFALGISDTEGWVLIRKLRIADPDAAAILPLIFPAGVEMLLMLPEEELGAHLGLDIGSELDDLGSAEVVTFIKELIASHAEYGATVENQPDGTVLLTIPLDDADAINTLALRLATKFGEDEEEVDIDIDVDDDLIGCTLSMVYDPDAELVKSLVVDFGDRGRVVIEIGDGEIDPALFDSSRVTTPNTRILDLSALESMFDNFDLGDLNIGGH